MLKAVKLQAAAGAAADGLIEIVERLGEHSQGVRVENPGVLQMLRRGGGWLRRGSSGVR